MTSKKLIIVSIVTAAVVFAMTSQETRALHQGIFNDLIRNILMPIFYICLGLTASSIIILVFNNQIFKKWLYYFAVGYSVIMFLILNMGWNSLIDANDVAKLLAALMVIITTVFTLGNKFLFKIK